MISKNLRNNTLTTTLKLCSQRKGKGSLAQKVLCNYVINSFKQRDKNNFKKIFENMLTNISLPFVVCGQIDTHTYKYRTYSKSVFCTIVDIIKQTHINKNRRPFGLDLRDSINKLLNSLNTNSSSIYKQKIDFYNTIKLRKNRYINLNTVINYKNNFDKNVFIQTNFNKFFYKLRNKKHLHNYNLNS